MVLSRIGCHRSPFGSFPREGKNSPAHRPMYKGTPRHQAQPKAHHPARNEGGPPVPPGRQRTTCIIPQVVPSRPREEANSRAQHEVPSSSQATRGPGAAMVLAQFGCHRSPFGSFPREGKNSPAHPPMCKGTPRPLRSESPPPPAHRAKASHSAGRQAPIARATGRSPRWQHRSGGNTRRDRIPLPPCIFRAIVL